MLQPLSTPSTDIFAFEAIGILTQEDYQKTLLPLLESAYEKGTKVRFLYYFGTRFEGFSPGAAWSDFKVGIRYLNLFERCAIVSDKPWILNSTKWVGTLIPCAVRTFTNHELANAMDWLNSGEIGLDHYLDSTTGILQIEITSPLTSENFEILSHKVDPLLEKGTALTGIIVHTKNFPGWENLGSFLSHMRFIKNHHTKIPKIAICADGELANILPQLANHFVKAEIKHFDFTKLQEAKDWIIEK